MRKLIDFIVAGVLLNLCLLVSIGHASPLYQKDKHLPLWQKLDRRQLIQCVVLPLLGGTVCSSAPASTTTGPGVSLTSSRQTIPSMPVSTTSSIPTPSSTTIPSMPVSTTSSIQTPLSTTISSSTVLRTAVSSSSTLTTIPTLSKSSSSVGPTLVSSSMMSGRQGSTTSSSDFISSSNNGRTTSLSSSGTAPAISIVVSSTSSSTLVSSQSSQLSPSTSVDAIAQSSNSDIPLSLSTASPTFANSIVSRSASTSSATNVILPSSVSVSSLLTTTKISSATSAITISGSGVALAQSVPISRSDTTSVPTGSIAIENTTVLSSPPSSSTTTNLPVAQPQTLVENSTDQSSISNPAVSSSTSVMDVQLSTLPATISLAGLTSSAVSFSITPISSSIASALFSVSTSSTSILSLSSTTLPTASTSNSILIVTTAARPSSATSEDFSTVLPSSVISVTGAVPISKPSISISSGTSTDGAISSSRGPILSSIASSVSDASNSLTVTAIKSTLLSDTVTSASDVSSNMVTRTSVSSTLFSNPATSTSLILGRVTTSMTASSSSLSSVVVNSAGSSIASVTMSTDDDFPSSTIANAVSDILSSVPVTAASSTLSSDVFTHSSAIITSIQSSLSGGVSSVNSAANVGLAATKDELVSISSSSMMETANDPSDPILTFSSGPSTVLQDPNTTTSMDSSVEVTKSDFTTNVVSTTTSVAVPASSNQLLLPSSTLGEASTSLASRDLQLDSFITTRSTTSLSNFASTTAAMQSVSFFDNLSVPGTFSSATSSPSRSTGSESGPSPVSLSSSLVTQSETIGLASSSGKYATAIKESETSVSTNLLVSSILSSVSFSQTNEVSTSIETEISMSYESTTTNEIATNQTLSAGSEASSMGTTIAMELVSPSLESPSTISATTLSTLTNRNTQGYEDMTISSDNLTSPTSIPIEISTNSTPESSLRIVETSILSVSQSPIVLILVSSTPETSQSPSQSASGLVKVSSESAVSASFVSSDASQLSNPSYAGQTSQVTAITSNTLEADVSESTEISASTTSDATSQSTSSYVSRSSPRIDMTDDPSRTLKTDPMFQSDTVTLAASVFIDPSPHRTHTFIMTDSTNALEISAEVIATTSTTAQTLSVTLFSTWPESVNTESSFSYSTVSVQFITNISETFSLIPTPSPTRPSISATKDTENFESGTYIIPMTSIVDSAAKSYSGDDAVPAAESDRLLPSKSSTAETYSGEASSSPTPNSTVVVLISRTPTSSSQGPTPSASSSATIGSETTELSSTSLTVVVSDFDGSSDGSYITVMTEETTVSRTFQTDISIASTQVESASDVYDQSFSDMVTSKTSGKIPTATKAFPTSATLLDSEVDGAPSMTGNLLPDGLRSSALETLSVSKVATWTGSFAFLSSTQITSVEPDRSTWIESSSVTVTSVSAAVGEASDTKAKTSSSLSDLSPREYFSTTNDVRSTIETSTSVIGNAQTLIVLSERSAEPPSTTILSISSTSILIAADTSDFPTVLVMSESSQASKMTSVGSTAILDTSSGAFQLPASVSSASGTVTSQTMGQPGVSTSPVLVPQDTTIVTSSTMSIASSTLISDSQYTESFEMFSSVTIPNAEYGDFSTGSMADLTTLAVSTAPTAVTFYTNPGNSPPPTVSSELPSILFSSGTDLIESLTATTGKSNSVAMSTASNTLEISLARSKASQSTDQSINMNITSIISSELGESLTDTMTASTLLTIVAAMRTFTDAPQLEGSSQFSIATYTSSTEIAEVLTNLTSESDSLVSTARRTLTISKSSSNVDTAAPSGQINISPASRAADEISSTTTNTVPSSLAVFSSSSSMQFAGSLRSSESASTASIALEEESSMWTTVELTPLASSQASSAFADFMALSVTQQSAESSQSRSSTSQIGSEPGYSSVHTKVQSSVSPVQTNSSTFTGATFSSAALQVSEPFELTASISSSTSSVILGAASSTVFENSSSSTAILAFPNDTQYAETLQLPDAISASSTEPTGPSSATTTVFIITPNATTFLIIPVETSSVSVASQITEPSEILMKISAFSEMSVSLTATTTPSISPAEISGISIVPFSSSSATEPVTSSQTPVVLATISSSNRLEASSTEVLVNFTTVIVVENLSTLLPLDSSSTAARTTASTQSLIAMLLSSTEPRDSSMATISGEITSTMTAALISLSDTAQSARPLQSPIITATLSTEIEESSTASTGLFTSSAFITASSTFIKPLGSNVVLVSGKSSQLSRTTSVLQSELDDSTQVTITKGIILAKSTAPSADSVLNSSSSSKIIDQSGGSPNVLPVSRTREEITSTTASATSSALADISQSTEPSRLRSTCSTPGTELVEPSSVMTAKTTIPTMSEASSTLIGPSFAHDTSKVADVSHVLSFISTPTTELQGSPTTTVEDSGSVKTTAISIVSVFSLAIDASQSARPLPISVVFNSATNTEMGGISSTTTSENTSLLKTAWRTLTIPSSSSSIIPSNFGQSAGLLSILPITQSRESIAHVATSIAASNLSDASQLAESPQSSTTSFVTITKIPGAMSTNTVTKTTTPASTESAGDASASSNASQPVFSPQPAVVTSTATSEPIESLLYTTIEAVGTPVVVSASSIFAASILLSDALTSVELSQVQSITFPPSMRLPESSMETTVSTNIPGHKVSSTFTTSISLIDLQQLTPSSQFSSATSTAIAEPLTNITDEVNTLIATIASDTFIVPIPLSNTLQFRESSQLPTTTSSSEITRKASQTGVGSSRIDDLLASTLLFNYTSDSQTTVVITATTSSTSKQSPTAIVIVAPRNSSQTSFNGQSMTLIESGSSTAISFSSKSSNMEDATLSSYMVIPISPTSAEGTTQSSSLSTSPSEASALSSHAAEHSTFSTKAGDVITRLSEVSGNLSRSAELPGTSSLVNLNLETVTSVTQVSSDRDISQEQYMTPSMESFISNHVTFLQTVETPMSAGSALTSTPQIAISTTQSSVRFISLESSGSALQEVTMSETRLNELMSRTSLPFSKTEPTSTKLLSPSPSISGLNSTTQLPPEESTQPSSTPFNDRTPITLYLDLQYPMGQILRLSGSFPADTTIINAERELLMQVGMDNSMISSTTFSGSHISGTDRLQDLGTNSLNAVQLVVSILELPSPTRGSASSTPANFNVSIHIPTMSEMSDFSAIVRSEIVSSSEASPVPYGQGNRTLVPQIIATSTRASSEGPASRGMSSLTSSTYLNAMASATLLSATSSQPISILQIIRTIAISSAQFNSAISPQKTSTSCAESMVIFSSNDVELTSRTVDPSFITSASIPASSGAQVDAEALRSVAVTAHLPLSRTKSNSGSNSVDVVKPALGAASSYFTAAQSARDDHDAASPSISSLLAEAVIPASSYTYEVPLDQHRPSSSALAAPPPSQSCQSCQNDAPNIVTISSSQITGEPKIAAAPGSGSSMANGNTRTSAYGSIGTAQSLPTDFTLSSSMTTATISSTSPPESGTVQPAIGLFDSELQGGTSVSGESTPTGSKALQLTLVTSRTASTPVDTALPKPNTAKNTSVASISHSGAMTTFLRPFPFIFSLSIAIVFHI